jgi:hypothetical protein
LPRRQQLNRCDERELDRFLLDELGFGPVVGRRELVQQAIGIRLKPWNRGQGPRRLVGFCAGAPLERIQAGIRGDAVEPRSKGRAASECPPVTPRAQEGLLDEIFRVLERAHHPVAVDLKLPTMRLEKLSERRLVARVNRGHGLSAYNHLTL